MTTMTTKTSLVFHRFCCNQIDVTAGEDDDLVAAILRHKDATDEDFKARQSWSVENGEPVIRGVYAYSVFYRDERRPVRFTVREYGTSRKALSAAKRYVRDRYRDEH